MKYQFMVVCRDSGPLQLDTDIPPIDGAELRELRGRGGGAIDRVIRYVAWTVPMTHPCVPVELQSLETDDHARGEIHGTGWSVLFSTAYEPSVPTLIIHDAPDAWGVGHFGSRRAI